MGRRTVSRREMIGTGARACAAAAVLPHAANPWIGGAPAIVQSDRSRPAMAEGIAAGDVAPGRAVIWSRTDRSSRMIVEYSTTETFASVNRRIGPDALESTDYTARIVLTDLPPDQRIFYRVQFLDLGDLKTASVPQAGSFRTAPSPASRRNITFAWSADTVGQGWGLNPDWGGLKLYETMRRVEPDVFIHCGDTIYADQFLPSEIKLDDGSVWKNVVTEAKSKVAETLDEYRGNYKYNLLDEHMRRFNAEVPQIVIWDDHEVRDNWYDARNLDKDDRYKVKSMPLLAARARQAFLEYNPIAVSGDDRDRIYRSIPYGPLAEVFALDMRSYRGANSENRQPALNDEARILGRIQVDAFKARLASSRATWKIIASDMPIGLVVGDAPGHFEAVANRDNGVPLGRELEIADLLRFIKARRIRNVVWVTGDVHYCAAHYYNPSKASFTDFDPFWEFVAGPLHAGTFGPGTLDATFGPEVKFTGIPAGMKPNRPPSAGFQFFGTLTIDARTRAMTAALMDVGGKTLFRVELSPGT